MGWAHTWKEVDREGFEQVKKLIRNNKLRNLIVWDLDRLYRNRKRLIAFFEFCKIHKCKIHSFRQQWLNQINDIPEPFGEIMHSLMLNVMGWIAEDESEQKSKRVKAAIRVKQGKTVSYNGNKWGRKPLSTFKRRKILRLSSEMMTMREIAKEVGVSVGAVHKTIANYTPKKLR